MENETEARRAVYRGLRARRQVLDDIEAKRHEQQDDRLLEAQLSVNDWIGRIRAASQTAHGCARAGVPSEEYAAWLDIAAIAAARAEQVFLVQWQ